MHPQWAEPIFKPISYTSVKLLGVPKGSFVIMFAGNIGDAQDFSSILEAANRLKYDKSIHWVILGGGRKEAWVRSKIIEYELEECFHLLGSYPLEKMPGFYYNADVMLFSLKDEYIFSITIPAKVQSYLASGKPILSMINGEGGSIIEEANAGLSCPAGSPDALANNVLEMKAMESTQLAILGENARKYYEDNFERSRLFRQAEVLLERMCRSS